MSTRVRVAAVLVTMLCVACDREHDSQQSPEASAVGTSGRSAGSVTAIVHASEPPVFVGRDRDGAPDSADNCPDAANADRLWAVSEALV